jgi:polyvinyl alcohol dehydrogenase (cytochrome)
MIGLSALVNSVCGAAACGLLMMTIPTAQADDWPMGGQDLNNSRNQDKTKISPQNVGQLQLKWVFTTGGDVSATPAVAHGAVYFPDFAGNFYAVNANTGSLKWQKRIAEWTGVNGDFARNDPAIYKGMLILGNQAGTLVKWNGSRLLGTGARVIAANAANGKLIWVTQVEAFPGAMVTSSPVVYNDIVYVGVASQEEGTATDPSYPCCVSRGSVVALDAKTGGILWQTYMVPAGDPNDTNHRNKYSGGAIWDSTPVIDPKRNSIYVGTGNNYSVPVAVQTCTSPAACLDPTDHFDSVVALDLITGKIRWATRGWPYDPWNVACIVGFAPGVGNCPLGAGPDYDFGGSGPNLFSNGTVLGIGQKSGLYWALNPDNGNVIWNKQVGPGTTLGGIEWGTATDGQRIYVPISNLLGIPYALQPSGALVNSGSWAALDPRTGNIMWQTPTPGHCSTAIPSYAQGCMALGPTSVANGVVFAASMDPVATNPTLFALDARSGSVLWSFAAGSSVNAGPAIDGDSLYWGSGYSHFGLGTPNNKVFAFSIK